MTDTIDPAISEQYGIVNYGKNGMQIIRDGASIAIFNDHPTQLANWQAAVAFCRMTFYTPAEPTAGSGVFLKAAADRLLQNPPYAVSRCVHGYAEGKCIHQTCINHPSGLKG